MTVVLRDDEFLQAWRDAGGSPRAMAKATGLAERGIYSRRISLERRGVLLNSAPHVSEYHKPRWAYHRLRQIEFDAGVAIVYSDAHYWPHEEPTTAFRALVKLCRVLKPAVIVANGDLIDGARISRFPPSGWAKAPTMTDELREMQERQAEIRAAAPKAALFRTIGNHDLRLDRHFATHADQFEGLPGTRLADFLPDWPESWSVKINDTFVKHRHRGGIHAGYNNVIQAGTSIVTGHLHQISRKPLRGLRHARIWGVETGTIAEHPADLPEAGAGPFEYLEDGPTNWACGFAVLTYFRGQLLPPEFCEVDFGKAWFRGSVVL